MKTTGMNRFNWEDTESSESSPQIEGLRWMCCSVTNSLIFFSVCMYTHTHMPAEAWGGLRRTSGPLGVTGGSYRPGEGAGTKLRPSEITSAFNSLFPVPQSLDQEHCAQNADHLLQQWAGPETTAVFQHTGRMDFVHYKPVPPSHVRRLCPCHKRNYKMAEFGGLESNLFSELLISLGLRKWFDWVTRAGLRMIP